MLRRIESLLPYRKTRQMVSDQGYGLAQAIVDTLREPLLVLDKDLRVIAANRSFYLNFKMNHHAHGKPLPSVGDGAWCPPGLRALLEKVVPKHAALEGYEVEHDFPEIGRRTLLLNTRKVSCAGNAHETVLLAIEDVTERRAIERDLQELLREKEVLLAEMQHRVANSLQIIASILRLKANSVKSEETRFHLNEAHKRVLAVAAVQHHLIATGVREQVAVAPYLSQLCATLAQSMIGDDRISVRAKSSVGTMSSRDAVSIGLIVTEGVINAVKYAFADDTMDSQITVTYEIDGSDWRLSIADNGIGKPNNVPAKAGLGTRIVNALAKQLDARVEVVSSASGTILSVVRTATSHATTGLRS